METGIRSLTSTDLRVTTTTATETLGAVGATADGRKFRYVKADDMAGLAAGLLGVAPVPDANFVGCSLAATSLTAVGTQVVSVSVGAAVNTDQFAGGYLVVKDGTGAGTAYRINGNTETAGAGDCEVTLYDAVASALDVANTVVDLLNPFNGVEASTTQGQPVGVATVAIAAGHHGWVQTQGVAAVLADGPITAGDGVAQSANDAGAIQSTQGGTAILLGVSQAAADTEYAAVALNIG